MKRILLSFLIISFTQLGFAGEGMWLPHLLKSLNEAEMQGMGMKMTAEDIYSVNKGSLKDAIVHFGGFCTSELISSEGLLLTNHHCGYGQIQSHSSIGKNYLKDGYWAATREDELSNPGLSATFIVSIEDVTEKILAGVGDHMDQKERQSIIDKNLAALKESTPVLTHQDIKIRPFFKGNQYFLFVTMTYNDVRLVGAPPESIGKFGSDTDNWVWPRHTGDFSLFRIYAGQDNMPAEYSPSNIPFTPKHFLPISLDGVEEDDFTMIFGFPGRTNEYLPSFAVEQIVDVLDPAKINIRDRALKIVNKEMRANEAIRLQYASKYARIANYWKKWIGEVQGLKSTGAVAKKQDFEKEFFKTIKTNKDWNTKYNTLLPEFEKLYSSIEPYAYARDYYHEIFGRNVELLSIMNSVQRLVSYHEKGDSAGFEKYKKRLTSRLPSFYKNYQPDVDQKVFASLIEMYYKDMAPGYVSKEGQTLLRNSDQSFETMAASLYATTDAVNESRFMALLEGDPVSIVQRLEKDPLYQFTSSMKKIYVETINAPYQELNGQIQDLQRVYMKALMEVFPNRRFYPDANSTMRVTYGQVKGYAPSDTVEYDFMTYLDGVIDKYVPGDYEFDVSPKLRELYRNKDYGPYSDAKNRMPVCFIGSNHTTGGNSGSPAIDAHGNLIGLNFDRAWEGTMSDINYDPSICRNIMVDIRYVLFVIDKFAGAPHLVEEMTLVHPKTAPNESRTLEDENQLQTEKIKAADLERQLENQQKMLNNKSLNGKDKAAKNKSKGATSGGTNGRKISSGEKGGGRP